MREPAPTGRDHVAALARPLQALDDEADRLQAWGQHLARVLSGGGRLLVAGNGGSAAQAQHLTSELVGRYRDERQPFSAIALCSESSSVTAIGNDYGMAEVFARQVRAHGRPGDVLVVLSTSGCSPNVIAAAEAGRTAGLTVWGLTGAGPNPLLACVDDAIAVDAPGIATVQEVHQVVVHLLCAAVELALIDAVGPAGAGSTGAGSTGAGSTPASVPVLQTRTQGPTHAATGPKVVVVGDALLDRDLDGTVERLCPDAPVPVVDSPVERLRPGGAALAAVLAAGDGASVILVTALADDGPGRALAGLLSGAGVEVVDLGLDGPTPEKIRVRTGGRCLVRIDRGGGGGVGPMTHDARTALAGAGAVLVADYGRGVAGAAGLGHTLSELVPRTPVVWDPHPRGAEPVPDVRLVTPNRDEARRLAPEVDDGLVGIAAVATKARELARRWRAATVAVTLGAEGALLAGLDGPPLVVPAPPAGNGDPCGAGDRFAAAAAVALAGGALVSEAVESAVLAASAFVAAGGAGGLDGSFTIPADDGGRTIGRIRAHAGTDDGAADGSADGAGDGSADLGSPLVARIRRAGGTVVATGGCFDLLHAGHVHMLQGARRLGDCLVVLLNSDDSVRRLKGPDRPLQRQGDRASVLAALDCVDAVVIFDEDTPVQALERLRPDLFAKGADYAVADLPEARTLARWGGEAVVLPYLQGRSTTRLLEEAVRRAP